MQKIELKKIIGSILDMLRKIALEWIGMWKFLALLKL